MSLPDNIPANPTPATIGVATDAPEIETAGTQGVIVPAADASATAKRGWWSRFGFGGTSSTFAASMLLMGSTIFAQAFSLLRNKLVARYFGAGEDTAAYFGGFQLPDMIYYLVIGGVASTAFITILTRYRDDEAAGDRALSAILNVVFVVLLATCTLGFIFAPWYVAYFFNKFSPHEAELCTHLTRILIVTPLLHFLGGVFAARLLVRRIFWSQALGSVFYSGGVVAGLILLHGRLRIDSMAVGAVAGALIGPLLTNMIAAIRVGLRWTPGWNVRHPAVREWLRISLPLMLGASLTTVDPWIRNHFISGDAGDMSRLNFARQIFAAPMSALGPAAGIASLPFFASLWVKGDIWAFSGAVNKAVSRMIAVSLLVSGWLIGLAPLLIAVLLRGGSFHQADSVTTAQYLVLYSLGLFLWTSQNLYARAFYAASDTLTPMVSGSIVVLICIPLYKAMFSWEQADGLVWAATLGMLLHTGALAILLHRKRMVSIAQLEYGEIARALLAAVLGGTGAYFVVRYVHLGAIIGAGLGSIVWAAICFALLVVTGSALPDVLLRRRRTKAA